MMMKTQPIKLSHSLISAYINSIKCNYRKKSCKINNMKFHIKKLDDEQSQSYFNMKNHSM